MPGSEAPRGFLEIAADELGARLRVSECPPVPLPVWAHGARLEDWLAQVRQRCLTPPPDITKAAEWLLDNHYQVRRAVQQVARDLPSRFYNRLPSLTNPGEEGAPRIFAIARTYLYASRLQIALSSAVQFVSAYQSQAVLSIAELWAFPTMLRLACLEVLVGAFSRLLPQLTPPFEVAPRRVEGGDFEDTEYVARALANLASIAAIPWKDFFERSSRVEAILRQDPAGVYPQMDFETRDRYRKALEALAMGAKRSESEVASQVLARARGAAANTLDKHVGHWLIGAGRVSCERALGYRSSRSQAWRRELFHHAGPLYAGALGLAGAAALLPPAWYLWSVGASPAAWALGVLLALLPASVLGTTLVHWLIALGVAPRVLPKMDFSTAIPEAWATAVVVPVLLASREEADELLERLELHYLANPDPVLRFVLLSDHADAPDPIMSGDGAVEAALVHGIRQLNARYGMADGRPFHLLHRARQYNPGEGCWMGWERKRGKLMQFNEHLLSGASAGFSLHEGDPAGLRGIRFVVTVDADTTLPVGTVARLVGTLAHPLNRAVFDAQTGRVRSGYTVLQPRVEIAPEWAGRSLFARFYTGDTAIDIYTRAVSDVYQDLFGSGIYVGKGIYEVASFQRCLRGRVPENALVSHDLFEGIHGRAGLTSDIVLYEGFPNGYLDYARRQHRWLRGDWQLLPWLWRWVPGSEDRRLRNDLAPLDRWKLLDNLRRSMIPPSLVALAAAGWLGLPGAPWVWTLLSVAVPGASLFTDLVTGFARGRRRGSVRRVLYRLRDHGGRWWLALVFLVSDAAIAVDACARTLWRLGVSRRHLLQWTTAAHQARLHAHRGSRGHVWRQMWPSPLFATLQAGLLVSTSPAALVTAMPLLLLWCLAPEIALRIGRPREAEPPPLDKAQRALLRQLARRTWLFFETFVGPGDNWLPPDNFQEAPYSEIAHRTSPTNIGMLFLSTLAATDLGYLGTSDLAVRIRRGLDTLDRLERYQGHWFNWYDTRLLRPLEPRYVSTVDSGNLAVSLLTLQQGCREIAEGPALRDELWAGLEDGFELLRSALAVIDSRAVRTRLDDFAKHCVRTRGHLAAFTSLDQREAALREAVGAAIVRQAGLAVEAIKEIHVWLDRIHHQLLEIRRDRDRLMPWLDLLDAPTPATLELARQLRRGLGVELTLPAVAAACDEARGRLARFQAVDEESRVWRSRLISALDSGCDEQQRLREGLLEDAGRAERMAFAMDFRPLYDAQSRLLYIGYNFSVDRLDSHHYDLLVSEARLASYFAILKGDVPLEHWFFLGRPLARLGGRLSLLSWHGSMFEYLMPALLLPSHPGSLLGQSERVAVAVQRQHARKRGIPWGVSESAFAVRDEEHRYRYRAFGVPELGLRRELADERVVAPYATALALQVERVAATENLAALQRLELIGRYGLYEAVDFTPERTSSDRPYAPVRAYMAHHQGMILAALDNALGDNLLVRRFGEDRRVKVMALLLHERIPQELPAEIRRSVAAERPPPDIESQPPPRAWVPQGGEVFPQVQVLGNGRMCSWISTAGAGGLAWRQQALTRWQPDATRDCSGLWVYVRDAETGALWSVGRQPTGVPPDHHQIIFHPHMVEFHRHDQGIGLHMKVAVATAQDVEMRQLSLFNKSDRTRLIQVTSYAEVVLSPPLDDERHPAFSKLFVGSEYLPHLHALLFTRRPRAPQEQPPLLLHRLLLDEGGEYDLAFESDREAFLGRHGDPRQPHGLETGLSGKTGWTLDPVMALQVSLRLEPGERKQLVLLTMASHSRESLLEVAEHYATPAAVEWAFADAASAAIHDARLHKLESDWLPPLQMLASLLLHPHPALRGDSLSLKLNRLGQPQLWGLSLSGDRPILLLRVSEHGTSELLRILAAGQGLWQRRGVLVDLVVLRMGGSAYAEPLREQLHALSGQQAEGANPRQGIHLLFADQLSEEERGLLESVARVVLDDAAGTLAQQLATTLQPQPLLPAFSGSGEAVAMPDQRLPRPTDLRFDNGLGGFSADGREYLIHLEEGQCTPAPWCNVLANDEFGSIVSEAGAGFSWALNSGENRLTPWHNDPLCDPAGEALYLRDEATAAIWTPTPLPAGGGGSCQIRHGAGYTTWKRHSQALEQELLIFVPLEDPLKIVRLRLRNLSAHPRRITATYYAEWLLGSLRSRARCHVLCEYARDSHTLLARNPWNPDFGERIGFLTATRAPHSLTCSRQDFLGREGHPRAPAGLLNWALGGRIEAGDDPCAAFQVHLDIAAGGTEEVVFLFGQGRDRGQAMALVQHWRQAGQVDRAFAALNQYWEDRLGAVWVETPDPAFDLMVNHWLLYQTLASRLLARAGFYQAGGAFGYRDQLQDVLALLHADPARARAQILKCAARQFEEGDVLHWWHPPMNRGVRTRCSDDLLWLPYVTSEYVTATGDQSILREALPYLQAPPLADDEQDRYGDFPSGTQGFSLFEHCQRALQKGITRGANGLPLMGAGDWNDGMDQVGRKGRGESVWLGWFAIATMKGFAGLARRMACHDLDLFWNKQAHVLTQRIQAVAWDGAWYLRALDDEGRPLGSQADDECQIDSIAQSWAVLADAGIEQLSRIALDNAAKKLICEQDRLIRLLWPPFRGNARNPGYISAYPPGIRENGGQYSHAAAWLGLAFAGLGNHQGAWRVFELLNPIHQARERYRVEPYVLAADIASVAPHDGRGGWTWYSGSAAWTWRLAVEAILGLRLHEGRVLIRPSLPMGWQTFTARIRSASGGLMIRVEKQGLQDVEGPRITLNGVPFLQDAVPFPTDGSTHRVRVRIV